MTDYEPIDLPGAVDDVDALPEHFRPAYKQHSDGKWRPRVRPTEDGWGFENIAGLRSAAEKEKEERRKAKAQLEALGGVAEKLEGLDIDEVLDTYNRVREGKMTDAEQVAKLKESMRKQFEDRANEERAKLTSKIESLTEQIVRDKVEAEGAKAFASVGGDAFVLMPHLRASCAVREIDGEHRAVVLNKDGEPRISGRDGTDLMTVEEFITEHMRGDPRFERYFGTATGGNPSERFGSRGGAGSTINRAKPGAPRLTAIRNSQSRGR